MFVKAPIFSELTHRLSQERIRPSRQRVSCYAREISQWRYRTASCFVQRSKNYCQWPVNV